MTVLGQSDGSAAEPNAGGGVISNLKTAGICTKTLLKRLNGSAFLAHVCYSVPLILFSMPHRLLVWVPLLKCVTTFFIEKVATTRALISSVFKQVESVTTWFLEDEVTDTKPSGSPHDAVSPWFLKRFSLVLDSQFSLFLTPVCHLGWSLQFLSMQ